MHDAQEIRDRYGPLVWRTVYRILGNDADALDCCQDVLCEAWQQSRQRDMHDAALRWLATRRAIDRLRQRNRSRSRFKIDGDIAEAAEHEPGPAESAEFNELIQCLRDQLSQLPAQQAEAFWMRCIEDMSYAEIAEQLAIDTNAVGVIIHRTKARLRTTLARFANRPLKD